MAVMRAGVTHWHAGLIEAGHGLICKAYAILLITHGPSHPITKDLEVGVIFMLSLLSIWAKLHSSYMNDSSITAERCISTSHFLLTLWFSLDCVTV